MFLDAQARQAESTEAIAGDGGTETIAKNPRKDSRMRRR